MRKIAVGIDLSAESELATAHAVDLARQAGAEVVMVMIDVVPDIPPDVAPSSRLIADHYTKILADRLAADRHDLGELRARWTGHGPEISQVFVDGFADERLPKVASEIGADLIVVGSHGRAGLKRWLLGSVAERVVRLAEQSVLVARGEAPSGGYRRVVIGTDFSPLADQAIARALPLIAHSARVDLVHAWAMPWASPLDGGSVPSAYQTVRDELEESLRQAGETLRANLRDQHHAYADVHFHLVEASPARGLAATAAEHHADLIVVGSHGRRGVRRFVLGSVAEDAVRHATCAVLVAR